MTTCTNLKIWLVLCCLSIQIMGGTNKTLGEEPVYFADVNLKTCAEAQLGISNPTPTDMLTLTELVAKQKNITDLSGLEYATNMQYLDLRYNLISNTSVLSILINLTELDLGYNQITDINALSSLTNLTKLRLRDNQISDITALSHLTNLVELSLYENQVVDVSPLSNLTNLTELSLMRNQIADINPLSNLTNLTNLHVSNNKVEDIDSLSGLTNLNQLGLGINRITDIGVLSNLTNLTWLNLYSNQVTDIGPLSSLDKLEQLYLTSNRISNIISVSGLTRLTCLTLGSNQITDINAISNLTDLTYLYLGDNHIKDITSLSALWNLNYLYLQQNQLTDIGVISAFSKLEYLHLYHNDISDINSLSGLTSLIELRLDDNHIVDIFPLTGLTNLRILDLRSNPLNQDACDTYIPHILENNPGIDLKYDPYIVTIIYVDDDAAYDPGPNNPAISDPSENGTLEHPFDMVQEAIHVAEDGDIVLVYPGLYAEEINFLGKAITVQSATDAAVLENQDDFAVSFYHGEGSDSVLRNFVIRNSFMGIFLAGSSPTISNVTVVDNKYAIEAYAGAEPDISNCILWNNTHGDLFGCRARYSCIERGNEGEGNIYADPLFFNPDNGDYHLRSGRGRYWPEHDVWVLDKITSPCINTGDPLSDYSNEPMPNGGRINMGAFGGTAFASMSEMNQPPEVSIISPEYGSELYGPVLVEVNAWDRDGFVVKVEFFANGDKIGEDNDISDAWKILWSDWTEGTHNLTAKATDNDGAVAISPEVEVTALEPRRR